MHTLFHPTQKPVLSILLAALLALVLAGGTPSSAVDGPRTDEHAQTAFQSRPVEQMLNADGTLDLDAGWSGALDQRGWGVALDDERGPLFQPAGSSPARQTASDWSALGTGTDAPVHTIAVSGSNVYVGGNFTNAGGVANTNYIAKWDGSEWSALGTGTDDDVRSIAVSGSDVYVGGEFTSAGTCTSASGCNHVAKWDGSEWSALGTGTNGGVNAIAVSGGDVYVGGWFTNAG
ncbi:MAG: hypothetical protein JXA14_11555, partial [Anaerolineae bacterium]|nr:hypothetical protein [Anaerolineae bacterium]